MHVHPFSAPSVESILEHEMATPSAPVEPDFFNQPTIGPVVRSDQGAQLGLPRYLVFALKSLFRDIQEDLIFVLVSVFSISRNLVENSFLFSAFPETSSKSYFCISCNFLFFSPPPVFYCFSLFFQFFPCFSRF